jgi:hypothetical protein
MTKSATISILSTVKIAKMIIVLLSGQLYDVLVDEGTLITSNSTCDNREGIHSY